jgi:hypothetical protein
LIDPASLQVWLAGANSSISQISIKQTTQTFGLEECSKSFADIGPPQHMQILKFIFPLCDLRMALLEIRARKTGEKLFTSY